MRAEQMCAAEYAQLRPSAAGRRLESMPADASAAFLQTLAHPTAMLVLEAMHVNAAAQCLSSLPGDMATSIISTTSPEQAARMLRVMPPEDAAKLMDQLPPATRRPVARVLQYPAGTAGAIMDPTVLTVTEDLKVSDARRVFRGAANSAYYYVYVVSRDDRLVGALDLRELFQADKSDTVASVMHPNPVSVSPFTDLAALAEHPAWKNVDALPVTDRQSKLIGFVRHRTIRRVFPRKGEIRLDEVGATVTRIGEMYWTTMGALVATLAAATARRPLPGTNAEGSR